MTRTTDTKLHSLFLDRWSPRAFDASDMPDEDLDTILDAARFAPSAMNHQPWRLLYAKRGDANWERFLSYLVPGNRAWAENASVLIYIASDKYMGERASGTHSFDAGAAWGLLALQATMLGYHSHGMAGVDYKAAAEGLGLPDTFKLEAAIALGRMGDPDSLSEALRAREVVSGRKARDEIAYPGNFRG
ncbi:nitroreductase family protein [Sphingobium nicotianae]|uniref:Nitroreductase family protein n=1 Tax=Sphingobium nicotianae TaxID=2782607 RepID=A0A9X1DA99_9SPHN|nr:nitroreductase family protein [Sphingobium nicotianae]MBT2186302.1 nitroreductase family protein [Sphingobium nicotianae]